MPGRRDHRAHRASLLSTCPKQAVCRARVRKVSAGDAGCGPDAVSTCPAHRLPACPGVRPALILPSGVPPGPRHGIHEPRRPDLSGRRRRPPHSTSPQR